MFYGYIDLSMRFFEVSVCTSVLSETQTVVRHTFNRCKTLRRQSMTFVYLRHSGSLP